MTRCTHCGGAHAPDAHDTIDGAVREGVRALFAEVRGRGGVSAEMWLAQARVLWRRAKKGSDHVD